MKRAQTPDFFIEPERYELRAAPIYHFKIDRREFFKVLGCGVVVVFLVEAAIAQESGNNGQPGNRGRQRPSDIGSWLHIGEDGTVTVFTGKAEVGQNIRTSLTQAVAEELLLPASSIRLVMSDTALTPFDAGTFGSRTTPDMFPQLRKVSAAARKSLLDLAAEHFKAERETLGVDNGKVVRKGTNESVTFAQLTKGQKVLKSITDKSQTTPVSEWKVAGTSIPKVDGRAIVTGKHKYSSDISLPGMLHGKILRPSSFEATLVSINIKKAEAIEGVRVVHEDNFVGVTAPDILTAGRGVDAIEATWAGVTCWPIPMLFKICCCCGVIAGCVATFEARG